MLDLGIIGRPGEEADLVPLALVTLLVLEIVDGVTALGRWKLGNEVVVRGRGGGLCDDDLGVVLVEGVDDVLDLLAKLELLELSQALLRDCDTGRLSFRRRRGVWRIEDECEVEHRPANVSEKSVEGKQSVEPADPGDFRRACHFAISILIDD